MGEINEHGFIVRKKAKRYQQVFMLALLLAPLVVFPVRFSRSAYLLLPNESIIVNKVYTPDIQQQQQQPTHSLDLKKFSDQKSIRKWGCHNTESPLIFVHIGKAGGGIIRARFAAAAHNFTREKWWAYDGDNHYYDMPISSSSSLTSGNTASTTTTTSMARGKFCSSKNNHRRIDNSSRFHPSTFETNFPCHATTPLGKFVGCPAFFRSDGGCRGCRNMSAQGCYVVYAGHNYFGNELHWLPAPVLQQWWNRNWASYFPPETKDAVQSITPGTTNPYWCPSRNETRIERSNVILAKFKYHQVQISCSQEISTVMDSVFQTSWSTIASGMNDQQKNYAPIYASLPVHRTVLLREPFSWLLSRFFWDKEFRDYYQCDDIRSATFYNNETFQMQGAGWAYAVILDQLMYLCGEDCINRFQVGEIDLQDIERQAESNLRHSFSVVGLLNETEHFFDMVSA
eukprot:scaffold2557_cov121-Cylindrotheca_fusiformis.AAC.14